MPITHLVPHAPHFYAATDASKLGMGGFWLPTTLVNDRQPTLWWCPWPPHITQRLLTYDNPSGDLNNSVLELAAVITVHHIQHQHIIPTSHTRMAIATDTPAQSWLQKGSVSNVDAPAFLLSLLAHDCHLYQSHLRPVLTPGASNTIADFLLRSFHLSDVDLLQNIPQLGPMKIPWKLVTPPAAWVSSLNLVLSRKLPPKESPMVLAQPPQPPGQSGALSAVTLHATRSSKTFPTPCPSSRYSLTATELEHYLPPVLKLDLARWKQPFEPWGRRLPSWDTRTPGYRPLET